MSGAMNIKNGVLAQAESNETSEKCQLEIKLDFKFNTKFLKV